MSVKLKDEGKGELVKEDSLTVKSDMMSAKLKDEN